MASSGKQRDSRLAGAPILGDHLAMNLLNTESRHNGEIIEHWNSGEDVLDWLKQCSPDSTLQGKAVDPDELLARALALRTNSRRLIVQRKESGSSDRSDLCGLNEYLHLYLSAPHLERDREGNLTLSRIVRGETIASLLGPVAEAVAELLVEGDFTCVKQCEHPDCILWFYDRTKAHKRRWCSMALCGNRYKAARFRKRSDGKTT